MRQHGGDHADKGFRHRERDVGQMRFKRAAKGLVNNRSPMQHDDSVREQRIERLRPGQQLAFLRGEGDAVDVAAQLPGEDVSRAPAPANIHRGFHLALMAERPARVGKGISGETNFVRPNDESRLGRKALHQFSCFRVAGLGVPVIGHSASLQIGWT